MKISVALCTYNGALFLKEQVESILNQSHPVSEIVVCDDGSSDTTKHLLEEYSERYPSLFRLFFNEVNLKSNKNFEKAIGLTTGDYIFLSDQDDVWESDKAEKVIAFFASNPAAEGVFTNAKFIGDHSKSLATNLDLWTNVNFFPSLENKKTDLFESLVYMGNFLTGAALCIKKEVKDFAIPFKTLPNFLHDEWLAFVLCNRKTLFLLDEHLLRYRLHSNQQIGMGKMKESVSIIEEKKNYAKLILGLQEPKKYKQTKSCLVRTVRQYQKYEELYTIYGNASYQEVKNKLLMRYQWLENKMRKQNPILFFLRKKKLKITQ
jgi:glycosyltransferase involved in cell wall biosynthesis